MIMDEKRENQHIQNPAAMIEYGVEVAARLCLGDVLALSGSLGTGKTHFTKGVVRGLGCNAEVTSPTFTLVHEYEGGAFPIYHFDFYRMDSDDEVLRIGWDEYLEARAIMIVEWAEKFPNLLPADSQWLDFKIDGHCRQVRWI